MIMYLLNAKLAHLDRLRVAVSLHKKITELQPSAERHADSCINTSPMYSGTNRSRTTFHRAHRNESTDSCWTYCCFQGGTSTPSPRPLCLPQAMAPENQWVRHCLHSGWPADTPPKLTNSCSVLQMQALCDTQHSSASSLHTVLMRRRRRSDNTNGGKKSLAAVSDH